MSTVAIIAIGVAVAWALLTLSAIHNDLDRIAKAAERRNAVIAEDRAERERIAASIR